MKREKVPGEKITVVIAEDDPIVRRVLTERLEAEPDIAILAAETDGERAIAAVVALKPTILLVDLFVNKPSVVQVVASSYGRADTRPVLMCSTFEEQTVLESLYLGAFGVWKKEHLEVLPECVRCVGAGGYWNCTHESRNRGEIIQEIEGAGTKRQSLFHLTSREQEVVLLTSSGMTNRDIGQHLAINEKTVKRHLTNVFDKLGMSNRVELTLFALQHGLVSPRLSGER